MQETRVQSLGWEDPLEEEMATHSSILAWKIPWTEEPGSLWVTKSWTWLKRLSMHAQSAFRLLASKTVRGCISIVLKALSLQRFVTAAIDSEYAQPHPAPDSCLHILHTCPAA